MHSRGMRPRERERAVRCNSREATGIKRPASIFIVSDLLLSNSQDPHDRAQHFMFGPLDPPPTDGGIERNILLHGT